MDNLYCFALIVQPKQEMLDWVNTIFPESQVFLRPLEDDEATVYLIPEFDSLPEARTWLRKYFKPILEQELEDWCIDSKLWPALSWKTFEAFLECRIHSMVLDATARSGRNKRPVRNMLPK